VEHRRPKRGLHSKLVSAHAPPLARRSLRVLRRIRAAGAGSGCDVASVGRGGAALGHGPARPETLGRVAPLWPAAAGPFVWRHGSRAGRPVAAMSAQVRQGHHMWRARQDGARTSQRCQAQPRMRLSIYRSSEADGHFVVPALLINCRGTMAWACHAQPYSVLKCQDRPLPELACGAPGDPASPRGRAARGDGGLLGIQASHLPGSAWLR